MFKTNQSMDEKIKEQFRRERVRFGFATVYFRNDRVYVSKAQADRARASLERLQVKHTVVLDKG